MEKETFHTEVWDKQSQTWRIWMHDKGIDEKLEKLGTPTRKLAILRNHLAVITSRLCIRNSAKMETAVPLARLFLH
jgi:hypothetical protein